MNSDATARYIEALATKTGLPFVSSFLNSGHFVVVSSQRDLPAALFKSSSDRLSKVCSVYDPGEKITWFVAENIPEEMVFGNMLREIGIHFGLKPMLGERKMQEVLADARHLFLVGNPAMLAAWRQVVPGGKKQTAAASGEEIQEALGYLVEDPKNHTMGIAQKIFSSVKIFLFKRNFPVGRLSEQDMAVLASFAAREAVRARRNKAARTANQQVFPERRQNGAYRKSIAQMTPDEMRRELLTDSLTRLGNRRALEEAELFYEAKGIEKVKAFLDVDSLKFFNDHMGGHEAGDKLLAVIGEALGKATKDSFRLSGDEFCFLADTEEDAIRIADSALKILQQVVIVYEAPDGAIYEYKNPGFSYGIGKDLETADRNMLENKKERAKAGLRADRAQPPPGLAQISPPRREDIGDPKSSGRGGYGPPSVKEYLSTFTVTPDQDESPKEPPPGPRLSTTFQP